MLEEQEKQVLKRQIQSNKHEIFIVSFEEMDAIFKSSAVIKRPNAQGAWDKIKDKALAGANYYAPAKDIGTLSKLIGDLGSAGTKVYVKSYGGKPHIILKGHPGLRKILTGTKYGINNPKVIAMGLGKYGATRAVRSGGILTIVMLTAYRVADFFMTDQATLSQLIGTLATDVVKVGIAVGASIIAATATAAVFTFAVGPLVAAIAIGLLVSAGLDMIDKYFGLTDKVIAGIDEVNAHVNAAVANTKDNIHDAANNAIDSAIDYIIDTGKTLFVDLARHYFNKLAYPTIR